MKKFLSTYLALVLTALLFCAPSTTALAAEEIPESGLHTIVRLFEGVMEGSAMFISSSDADASPDWVTLSVPLTFTNDMVMIWDNEQCAFFDISEPSQRLAAYAVLQSICTNWDSVTDLMQSFDRIAGKETKKLRIMITLEDSDPMLIENSTRAEAVAEIFANVLD